ncbi:hypothetical protein QYE76_062484 [Lolium multiflorum]|uniref:SIAH-type domain-containing protein n=1 Tax=Lolium multiflorum TaxID=4521 RepID=A0AAD8S3P3_LOLMU|nr:hypothetical protein QYE76_062484 [Lolium multiflorum]
MGCRRCVGELAPNPCKKCEQPAWLPPSNRSGPRLPPSNRSGAMVKCVGCQSLVASTESYKHYIACPHGPCGCTEAINTGCSFTGPPRELLVHLQASHSIPVFTFQYGIPAWCIVRLPPFGLPCVLCCDPADKPWAVFKEDLPVHSKCKLLPLDRFSYDGLMPHGKDEERAGANGDWIAMVGPEGKWNLLNVYTHRKIKLPSLRDKLETTHNPLIFEYQRSAIRLQKIAICQVPTAARGYQDFSLVAIFDFAIAYLHGEYPRAWIFLENQFQYGAIYCDAIIHNGLVFAVTELGNVYAWDPNQFDDKKHRVEENSILSDDKGEMACQSFKPPTPPCLLSMETDAAGPGTDEPIPGIIVSHEEGCGLGLPPAETGGAAGAASVEPLVNGVVPREFSELEQNGLPIVKTDITGADAGVATDDPAPEVCFALLKPVLTTDWWWTWSWFYRATDSYEPEHVPDVPSVEPDAPVSSGDDQEGSASLGQDVSCHSPELKSATVAYIARTVLQALKIQLGGSQDQLLQAIVTTKDQPACFVISCILFDKLKHCNWRIVQSHQHGERSYVYVKMIHADLVRFHDKMYGWGEARATFCSIHTVFALEPDPMDAYPVVQLS